MPQIPDSPPPPVDNNNDGLGATLNEVKIPGDSATVTRPLPERVRVQGEHLEPASDKGSLDDPMQPTAGFVALLARTAQEVFLGGKGDQLNTFFRHTGELVVWRLGISSETGAGLSSPSNSALLDAAGVSLLQAVQGFGRVRAVLDMQHIAELPAHLGSLRFRRKALAVVDVIREAVARGVLEEEVAVDKLVRPAFARLKPLFFALPIAQCLEPLRLLIEQPSEKAQVTRSTWEKGHEEGLAKGRAEAALDAQTKSKARPAEQPTVVVLNPSEPAPPSPAPAPTSAKGRTRSR